MPLKIFFSCSLGGGGGGRYFSVPVKDGGVAKLSSVSWVAKFKGDKNSEWKLSNWRSRSYREIKVLLSAGKWVVAKLQGDKSAPQSSTELYDPWISGPLCFS